MIMTILDDMSIHSSIHNIHGKENVLEVEIMYNSSDAEHLTLPYATRLVAQVKAKSDELARWLTGLTVGTYDMTSKSGIRMRNR